MKPESESLLIQQARDNPDAFRDLYRMYFPRVFGYVAYRVGRNEDAEDITAEIFMTVVEKFETFTYRGDGSFAAWLFRIAHNRVLDFFRRHPSQRAPLPLDDLPEMQSMGSTPDDAVQQKEKFARLHGLIKTLAPRRQEIITLRYFGGLRNQEIAEVLGLDERTVAAHLSRGLNDLQQLYGAKDHEHA